MTSHDSTDNLLPNFHFASTKAVSFANTFLMKDVYTAGADTLIRRLDSASPSDSRGTAWPVLDAYGVASNMIDPASGKPDLDKLLWHHLARMHSEVNDPTISSVSVGVVAHANNTDGPIDEVFLSFDLGNDDPSGLRAKGLFTFVHMYRTTLTAAEVEPTDFAVRRTGSMGVNEYFDKFSGYALSVNQGMARRAVTGFVPWMVSALAVAGAVIDDSWMPVDTRGGFARYHITDGQGIVYVLDFDAVALTRALAAITQYYAMAEDEGGVFIESVPTEEVAPFVLPATDDGEPTREVVRDDVGAGDPDVTA